MLVKLRNNRNQNGFTMVEVMIVIAIIGIMAAIAIPNFMRYKKNAEDIASLSAARNAYTAALSYLADNASQEWPDLSFAKLQEGGFRDTETNITIEMVGTWIRAIPKGGRHYYEINSAGHIDEYAKP